MPALPCESRDPGPSDAIGRSPAGQLLDAERVVCGWRRWRPASGSAEHQLDHVLVLEQVIPGVGFDEFIQKYIKGNEPLPDDPKLDKAAKLGTAKY